MKVIILAGGMGSRISFYTHRIPKPMIKIGNSPMLSHIMRIFKYYGYCEFIIAAGYKKKVIEKYYRNSKEFPNLKIINTGINTMTGGRILKLKKYFKKGDNFFVTYGDGVSNINLKDLVQFHKKKGGVGTVTAVRPPVKFGEMNIHSTMVKSFVEKPQLNAGWINGGFFVFNFNLFQYIKNNKTILERQPLVNLTKKGKLYAYQHTGYWRCMDNKNEKDQLEKIYKQKKTIWKIK